MAFYRTDLLWVVSLFKFSTAFVYSATNTGEDDLTKIIASSLLLPHWFCLGTAAAEFNKFCQPKFADY